MPTNINCIHNGQGAWCKHKDVKRSLMGIGARCCTEYPFASQYGCKHIEKHARPTILPSAPPAPKSIQQLPE
jgi:hypothetical protein